MRLLVTILTALSVTALACPQCDSSQHDSLLDEAALFEPLDDFGDFSLPTLDHVGTRLLYEDREVKMWELILPPGQSTFLHRHDLSYHSRVIQASQLEVYAGNGTRLLDFRAEGVSGFAIKGEFLVPVKGDLLWPMPRLHKTKNIGSDTYYELLIERKM